MGALWAREQPALGAGRHFPGRPGHAAHNMAALQRITLNFLTLMQQYFWPKMSIRRLRKMVARNPARLESVMAL